MTSNVSRMSKRTSQALWTSCETVHLAADVFEDGAGDYLPVFTAVFCFLMCWLNQTLCRTLAQTMEVLIRPPMPTFVCFLRRRLGAGHDLHVHVITAPMSPPDHPHTSAFHASAWICACRCHHTLQSLWHVIVSEGHLLQARGCHVVHVRIPATLVGVL